MQKIQEMLEDAEAGMNKMGAETVVERLYSGDPTSEFTSLKENWILGYFADLYNNRYGPKLVWAVQNQRGTNRADFSVYGEDQSHLCDIEVTSVWSKPHTKNPKGYQDFSPFPVWSDPVAPEVLHQDIDSPPKVRPYAMLKDVIKSHLRNAYQPYWLVIYDNEHGVQHPNHNQLANRIRDLLQTRAASGSLPASLKQVWAFDSHGVVRVFPFP